jgi:predicted dienelactone hydrolase
MLRSLRWLGLWLALLAAAPAQAGRERFADPGALGPYAVGHRVFTAVDHARADRPLPSEIWYPADPGNTGGVPTFYNFGFLRLGLLSDVAFENAPPSHDVAFPLIVFSHGHGGVSWQSISLMEHLASHGFVVVAPNHTGDTFADIRNNREDAFPKILLERPQDVSFLIDLVLARSQDPLDWLFLKVNPFLVGVAGHSLGGFTALAMAGGYADPGSGAQDPPDPRVRAVAGIAPYSVLLSDAELSAISVPLFLLSGTLDTTAPIDPNTTRPFELASGRPIDRADLIGATHEHFANVCDIGQVLLDLSDLDTVEALIPDYAATCLPPALPVDEAKRIQSFYLTAFFKRHLYGDARFDAFLTEAWAAAHEPLVLYQRKN